MVARTGTLHAGRAEEVYRRHHVGGIPAEHWISFFRLHAEAKDPDTILQQLTRELMQRGVNEEATADIVASILRIVRHLG